MKRGRAYSSVVDTSLAMRNTLGSLPSDTLAATINIKDCTILTENELKMEFERLTGWVRFSLTLAFWVHPNPQMQQWAVRTLMRLEMTVSEDRFLPLSFLPGSGVSQTCYDKATAWISKCFPAGSAAWQCEGFITADTPSN